MSDISSSSDSISDTLETQSTRSNKSNSNKDEENQKPVDPITFFNSKELCYYIMIDKYYKKCELEKIDKIKKIVDGDSTISLRVLDWFITKFSKKKSNLENCTNDKIFDINLHYKSQLKSYKKKYFDPFRRRKKFNYNYDKNNNEKIIYTTLGQLNFFKWALNNRVIEYVEENLDKIIKAMNVSNKQEKEIKIKKLKLKKIVKYIKNNDDYDEDINNDNSTDIKQKIINNEKKNNDNDDHNLTLTFD